MADKDRIRDYVRENYAKVARRSAGGGCCAGGCGCGPQASVKDASARMGYSERDLYDAPQGSNMGLGCGNPTAIASLKEGETVLDLGSGGGFDCFLASRRVGETGCVIGVDMTPDMVTLAREKAARGGYANVDFRLGEIENLPVADHSVDVIISNCVINLSPDKERVFREAYRVLKPGGRLAASDILATAELPPRIREDLASIAGCVGGAETVDTVRSMLRRAGFTDIRLTPKDNSAEILDTWSPGTDIGRYIASYVIEASRPA